MANSKEPTTAQELLQQRVEQNQKAAEVIDRDPEEAMAKLEGVVTVDPSAGELTMRDIFGLFMQLQKQTNAMQERVAEQQNALLSVLSNQQQNQGRTKADTQRELEEAALQQRMTLDSWKTEPREPVYLTPELSEEKVHAVMNEFPPRLFRINGLEFPIPVGQVIDVPQSVAAIVRHSQRQRPLQRSPQQYQQIPDPQHLPFLAGGYEATTGQAGRTGEGRLIPAAVASSPDQAQPLDLRYDQYGR